MPSFRRHFLGSRISLAGALAIFTFVTLPATAAHATWEKISTDVLAQTSEPTLGVEPSTGKLLVAWPATPGGDSVPTSIQARAFSPSLPHPAGQLGAIQTPVSGWNAIGESPAYAGLTGAGDSPQLLFSAFSHNGQGNGGTYVTDPTTPGLGELPFVMVASERGGDLTAVQSFMGAPSPRIIWANNFAGGLATYAYAGSTTVGTTDAQAQLGGCCAYHPTLAKVDSGNIVLAWYSSAAPNPGLYVLQIDPISAAPVGGPVRVPESESPANNFQRLALSCAQTCRIFYGRQTSPSGPIGLVSWGIGSSESQPTPVKGADDLTLSATIAAAPVSNAAGTWVAWYDRGKSGSKEGYRATIVDGAPHQGVYSLGKPKGAKEFGQLLPISAPKTLLLYAVAGPGNRGDAVWAEETTTTGDPAIPNTDGIKSATVAKAGSAIAVVPGLTTPAALKKHGLPVRIQSMEATQAAVKVCVDRAGHPPSPCRSSTVKLRAPGTKLIDAAKGLAADGGKALVVTLGSGGKSDSVGVKLKG
jgi:hypothetical protein